MLSITGGDDDDGDDDDDDHDHDDHHSEGDHSTSHPQQGVCDEHPLHPALRNCWNNLQLLDHWRMSRLERGETFGGYSSWIFFLERSLILLL